ncbi:amidase family protein [Cupriavidus consociatus]|uniref:amidase family protein n=1 Tax=Cupriavidus consociatus TaxID=2821357 RepID=UPI001FD81FD6|nr:MULTISPECIES: amidase family protein [unclassified Cupriavidus]MDK2659101.1 amidase family protein [Cupriavidus sp. LEh21]
MSSIPISKGVALVTGASAAFGSTEELMPAMRSASSGELHELGLAAAARAIRTGEISSEAYVGELLERAHEHADLKAFITIDGASVLEAASQADRARRAGHSAPLLGVPLAVKDSYLTKGLTTTMGTSVLAAYRPTQDAEAIAGVKDAGAIIFGKNNLVEMSYGLTGLNAHHGQVKNPYNKANVTGGSSSGAGASVAARIVPAALGGDTVGSIRVPASLCGVVGYKPTPGRWPAKGVAPISDTLDTTGLLARRVEDCELLDAVLTKSPVHSVNLSGNLKGVRFAYAPRQYLADVDVEVDRAFRETLRRLKDAGAELVEIDLKEDFLALADSTTWSIFFHETMPAVRRFIAANQLPISFEEIYAGLGENIRGSWSHFVVASGAGFVSDEKYLTALNVGRQELSSRLAQIAFGQADALLFPTTPCAAPRIENQWNFQVGGKDVTHLFLSRNTHPSSSAGLPGINIPMALNSEGLPLGLELDAAAGRDRELLALARRVEQVLGYLPGPTAF